MKVHIKLKSEGAQIDSAIEFNSPFTIGRGQATNSRLNDAKISTTHCQLLLTKTGLEIVDLESKNGTYVNGLKIKKVNLYIGDVIKIGDYKITIVPERMDHETIKILTYKGAASRAEGQLTVDKEIDPEAVAIAKGIVRKNKIKKDDGLNPDQTRQHYKKLYILGTIINFIILFVLITLPVGFINIFQSKDYTRALIWTELGLVTIFYLLNFKVMKFSIGEKIVGLEKKYINQ